MKKNYEYKKTEIVIYMFYLLFIENKEIKLVEFIATTGISRGTFYNVLSDIRLALSSFDIYELDIESIDGVIKKNRKELINPVLF